MNAVKHTTTITTLRSTSIGIFLLGSMMQTPITPPTIWQSVQTMSNLFSLMNLGPLINAIRYAQDPIIIGNAAQCSFRERR